MSIIIICSFGLNMKAQDVQLVVPKLSIENALKTLLDARAASFSSYTSGFGVDMYNIKLTYNDSHPLIVELIPPNRFRINCGVVARANVDYIAGNFQINGEGDITIEGTMVASGSQGQITLYGTADAVIGVNGVPGFVLNIINANQFTVNLPTLELATFVYTLPSIPLNYFTTNYPTISITNDNVILGLQTPSNFLILDQRDESGQRISGSQIAHWNNDFQNYTVPKVFNLPINTNQTFRGSQQLLLNPSQKFNSWNRSNNIINHNTFFLNLSFSRLNSDFKKTYSDITVKNLLEDISSVNGGTIQFKDPWLIDYPDPQYGNTLRNQGMAAPFKQRLSPFNPDYTTNYNGDVYKGVFLNQGYNPVTNEWKPPYYSVRAISPQDIQLQHTGRTHRFYFQNWSASPQGGAEFQNANSLET
ncbi:MAG: hypothetical protein NZM09_07200, partial [Ignavibacterium sp.]|nr:hypothetical protein [Ignavibacterium sp.]MDW8375468.1 hypothetical protein [Ignavibacteriales bacterium]